MNIITTPVFVFQSVYVRMEEKETRGGEGNRGVTTDPRGVS